MSVARSNPSRTGAHRLASTLPADAIAAELQTILGPALATVALGSRDPKAIGQWARKIRRPRPAQDASLRALYQVTACLAAEEEPDVIRAWFAGMNPDLDDQSPALVMRTDPAAVMRAAESFLRNG